MGTGGAGRGVMGTGEAAAGVCCGSRLLAEACVLGGGGGPAVDVRPWPRFKNKLHNTGYM